MGGRLEEIPQVHVYIFETKTKHESLQIPNQYCIIIVEKSLGSQLTKNRKNNDIQQQQSDETQYSKMPINGLVFYFCTLINNILLCTMTSCG